MSLSRFVPYCLAALAAAALIAVAGCDLDDDDYDEGLPAGQGAIVVLNNTPDDVSVYIDSAEQRETDAFDDRRYIRDPGVYRLVLEQQGGRRSYREDIDVIADRVTIVDIAFEPGDPFDYDVIVRID